MIPGSPIAVIDGVPIFLPQALGAAGALAVLLRAALIAMMRSGAARRLEAEAARERQEAIEARFAALAQSGAELNGRVAGMTEWLGSRQTDLARVVADRLDSVGARLGAGLETQAQTTGENLGKLNERLAVIDAAQARLTEMTREVVSLKDILSNKQARGAFGQGRMEAIVRDGLPAGAYDFQFTLTNRARPDCVIRLPGDARLLAVDAKFPLEGFSALRAARDEEGRKNGQARVRADVGKHVKDIAERYLLPGETQDIALMFVPSEAIYSDLVEHFDDVVQKAHRARVVIVSPTLMMMAINVAQAIPRRAHAGRSAGHPGRGRQAVNDVRLLGDRAAKLETHFRQAQEDLSGIGAASQRIARRGERIEAMDFRRGRGGAAGPHAARARGGVAESASSPTVAPCAPASPDPMQNSHGHDAFAEFPSRPRPSPRAGLFRSSCFPYLGGAIPLFLRNNPLLCPNNFPVIFTARLRRFGREREGRMRLAITRSKR